jgi:hypothetical protein
VSNTPMIRPFHIVCIKTEHHVLYRSSSACFSSRLSIALQPCQIVTNLHPMLIYWPFQSSKPVEKSFSAQVGGSSLPVCRGTMMTSPFNSLSDLMGNFSRVGSLVFPVSEESIVVAMKFPRVGDRWFKQHQLP